MSRRSKPRIPARTSPGHAATAATTRAAATTPPGAPPPALDEQTRARTRRRRLRLRLAGIAALAAAVAATFTVFTAQASSSAGWLLKCAYVNSAPDDPIVHADMPGMSHLHDFYGNKSVTATSTYQSMTRATSTCTSGDTAGYWTPALYRNGVKINPAGAYGKTKVREQVYYRANNLSGKTTIVPFPADFRMIAGNSKATTPAQNPELGHEIYWGCSDNSESGKPTTPVNCKTGVITLHIGFPNCWNGIRNPTDDTPNVVYPSGDKCPAKYPKALPRLIERFEYPVGTSSAGITLSSGPVYTVHADFWNTWQQASLQTLVANCLNAHKDCGTNPKI
jgi:hypothetical protein